MQERSLEMSQKNSEKSQIMTELSFVSRMMKERIAPPGAAASKTERIRLAAQKLKWKYSRTFSAWYADPRVSIKPAELRDVEVKTGVKYEEFAAPKDELAEVDQLISKAESLLDSKNPLIKRALAAATRAFIGSLSRARVERRGQQ